MFVWKFRHSFTFQLILQIPFKISRSYWYRVRKVELQKCNATTSFKMILWNVKEQLKQVFRFDPFLDTVPKRLIGDIQRGVFRGAMVGSASKKFNLILFGDSCYWAVSLEAVLLCQINLTRFRAACFTLEVMPSFSINGLSNKRSFS